MHYRLTLVLAPAGSAAASRLGRWARQCPYPVAFVRLQDKDNVLERFLQDLGHALHDAGLSVGTGLQLRPDRQSEDEEAITHLINLLADVPNDFALVLDNYAAIRASSVHHWVTMLLDYMPPKMHMYISSSTEPPLPLARLLARRQMLRLAPLTGGAEMV